MLLPVGVKHHVFRYTDTLCSVKLARSGFTVERAQERATEKLRKKNKENKI